MANEVPLVMAGNLTADPELRYTNSGVPVVNLSIAQTPRTFDRASGEWKDGEAVFMRGTVWRDQAEHVAASLVKGQRVVAIGSLVQKSYQDREGNPRTSFEFEIDEIAPSLRYGTTTFTKSPPRQQGAAAAPQMAPQAAPAAPAPGVNPPQYQQPVQQQYQQPGQAPVQYQQPVQQAAPVQQQAPVQYQQPAQAPAQAPVPVGSNVSDDEF